MRKYITPAIYASSSILVFILSIFSITVVERTIGFHTMVRQGDIDALVIILSLGVIIFGLFTKLLYAFEQNNSVTLTDHFRISSILYGVFFLALVVFLSTESFTSFGLQSALLFLVLGVSLVGIMVNGFLSILYKKNLH